MASNETPDNAPDQPLQALAGYLSRLVEGRLWAQVLIGMLLGLGVGVLIGPGTGWLAPETGAVLGDWLAFPGRLFLVSIQMIVVPLVFASIIRGLAGSSDAAQLKRLGFWATGFFLISTAIAATIGIELALVIEPGAYLDMAIQTLNATPKVASPATPGIQDLPRVLIDLLPQNPLNALVEGQMLQIVLFAFVVGVALVSLPASTSKPLLDVLGSLQEVCMTVVRWAMMIAPVAVFGLMAQLASRTGLETMIGLSVYVLTVLIGLVIVIILYSLFLRLVARMNPLHFLKSSRELLLLAFSTSSSAAVMPLSMKTAVEKFHVRPEVAEFVIPLGATVNMNGTALYQAVAAVFLAQVFDVEISTGGLALIVAMAVGASVGSPATPGVGIVILAGILASVGVPPSGIALIIGVDRLLDMSRTAVNVMGDLTACAFVDRWVLGPKPEPDTRSAESAPGGR